MFEWMCRYLESKMFRKIFIDIDGVGIFNCRCLDVSTDIELSKFVDVDI